MVAVAPRGVKELVDGGILSIPTEYVLPSSERVVKADNPEGIKIPVIDLSGLDGPLRPQILSAIREACIEWGFFQVFNHGIPLSTMQSMIQTARDFFDMPPEKKMAYFSSDTTKLVRYGTSYNPSAESTKEWRDYLRHPCSPLPEIASSWPDQPSNYREHALKYSTAIKKLGERLLGALSESLGLDSGAFQEAYGSHGQTMMLNYYPACPNPDLAVGLSGHSDAGGMTILMQEDDVVGLQVLNRGRWIEVKPIPGTFVVNMGDPIEILSNGAYKSVLHRATVNSVKPRISIASFYHPSMEAKLTPMPQLVDACHPALYRPVVFGEYVRRYITSKLQGKSLVDSLKLTA